MESMESKAIETIMKTDGVYKLPKSNYDLCCLVLEVQRSVDELPVKRHIFALLGTKVLALPMCRLEQRRYMQS